MIDLNRLSAREALQLVLDFYNMPTDAFCAKYGAGMTTKDLANACRSTIAWLDSMERTDKTNRRKLAEFGLD